VNEGSGGTAFTSHRSLSGCPKASAAMKRAKLSIDDMNTIAAKVKAGMWGGGMRVEQRVVGLQEWCEGEGEGRGYEGQIRFGWR
jgi:hypothetical protein